MNHRRGLRVAVLLAGLLLAPAPALALSEEPSRVVYGNAATLRRGEIRIGLFAPFQYGALERVTLMSHPILDLLLTPNVFLRLNLVHLSWLSVSIDGGYAQSFLRKGEYPGFATASLIHSFYLGRVATLSARYAYLFAFNPSGDYAIPSVYVTFLLPRGYRIHLAGIFPYALRGGGFTDVSGKLLLEYRLSTVLVALGLSVGRSYLVDAPILKNPIETPVYPVVDVVWEF
jgi:hypothetical protein